MLKKRTITGAVLTVLAVAFYRLADIARIPELLAALLAGLGGCELYRSFAAADRKPEPELLCILSGALCAFVPWPYYERFLPPVFLLLLVFSLSAVLQTRLLRSPGLLCSVWLSVLAGFLFHALPALCAEAGKRSLLLPFLCCMFTDIAAYFIGKRFGRRKLAPGISPNKTLEGSLGGTAAALLAAAVYALFFCRFGGCRCRWGLLFLYALCTSFLGQLGDLSLSCIKRSAGIKDFGHILPGHGGILDRFDSLLYALPFSLCFSCYMPALFY